MVGTPDIRDKVIVACLAETESSDASVESEALEVQRVWPAGNLLRRVGCVGHRLNCPRV